MKSKNSASLEPGVKQECRGDAFVATPLEQLIQNRGFAGPYLASK